MTLLPICLDFGGHVAKLFRALRAEEHRWQLSMAWCFLLSWQRLCCKMQASNLDVQRMVGAISKASGLSPWEPATLPTSLSRDDLKIHRSTLNQKCLLKYSLIRLHRHTDNLIRSIRSYMVYAWRIESVNLFCCRGLAWRCCSSFYRHVSSFFSTQNTFQNKKHKENKVPKRRKKCRACTVFAELWSRNYRICSLRQS